MSNMKSCPCKTCSSQCSCEKETPTAAACCCGAQCTCGATCPCDVSCGCTGAKPKK